MSRSLDISANDRQFLLGLLHKHKVRRDNRSLSESRHLSITFGDSYGHVNVSLGLTQLVVRVSAEIVRPPDDRPHEGTLVISSDTSAMTHPRYGAPSTPSIVAATLAEDSALLTRTIETAVKRAAALDLESLVIKSGRAVWVVRADIHYLADDGALIDASSIAVLAGLLHFKLPAVDVKGENEWIVYPEDVRPPVALSVLHIPLAVTFSLFKADSFDSAEGNNTTSKADESKKGNDDSDSDDDMESDGSGASDDELLSLVDATATEELLRDGSITFTVNSNYELCHILMPGGITVPGYTVITLSTSAFDIVKQRTAAIKKYLEEDENLRRAKRMDSAVTGGEEAGAEHNRI